mgnify:CR=1 FL=1
MPPLTGNPRPSPATRLALPIAKELLRGVEPVSVLRREHAADRRGFHRRENEAGHRQRQQLLMSARLTSGSARHRQAARDIAEEARRPRSSRCRSRAARMPTTTTTSATGRFFKTLFPSSSIGERREPERQRRRMRAAESAEEVAHPLPEIAVAAAEPEQLGQLRAREKQRDAALEADQHGFREEVDDRPGADGVGREREHRRR